MAQNHRYCSYCIYWVAKHKKLKPYNYLGYEIGICHRYPPDGTVSQDTDEIKYKRTTSSYWCGEFEKIPSPIEEADEILNEEEE